MQVSLHKIVTSVLYRTIHLYHIPLPADKFDAGEVPMSIIHDIQVHVKPEGIARRIGIRKYSKARADTASLIEELLAMAQNNHLIKPAIVYNTYQITGIGNNKLAIIGDVILRGKLLASNLTGSQELVVAICTIGPKLEKAATEYYKKVETLRSLITDGIGSAAVDSLVWEACRLMKNEALTRGYQASGPLSPGMSGFPLSQQQTVFSLVPAYKIGVRLTKSGVMVPRKSSSFVIGMGPQVSSWTQRDSCARCNLQKTCPYAIT